MKRTGRDAITDKGFYCGIAMVELFHVTVRSYRNAMIIVFSFQGSPYLDALISCLIIPNAIALMICKAGFGGFAL